MDEYLYLGGELDMKFKNIGKVWLTGLLLLTPLLISSLSFAQNNDDEPDTIIMMPPPPLEVAEMAEQALAWPNIANHSELKAYVDGVVDGYMKRDKIAGVTISIVKDNQVIYANGYGAAGLDNFTQVSPNETLFRIGSISKTFVWTALMQLSQADKLNLDDPVNKYLPLEMQLPSDEFEKPILISHLMTHTLGLEDSALGHLFVVDETKQVALKKYLASHRPEQVREAGVSASYSNYGAAIAGVIVEEVSGLGFNEYIEENIFAPLGMLNSSFREPYAPRAGMPAPISAELAEKISAGFAQKNGRLKEQSFEYIQQVAPAGAMSSTAEDMSRYMLAHLNYGELYDQRILSEQVAKLMQQPSFRPTPTSNGYAHGFMEYSLPNGVRGIGHGGATLYFMSNMVLVPELNLGIFISSNTNTGFKLAFELPGLFVEHFLTDAIPTSTKAADKNFADKAKPFLGSYLTDRHSYSGLEKILALVEGFIYVGISPDGYLTTSNQLGTTSWAQVSPLHFMEVNGYKKLAFAQDEDGNITKMFNDFGTSAATKVGFFNGQQWFVIITLLTLLGSLGAVIGAWLRRKRHINESLNESVASRLAALLSFIWLLFFVFLFLALAKMAELQELNVFSFPPSSMNIALSLAIIGLVLTIINLPSLFVIWSDANWPAWRRIRHSLIILLSFSFILTLYHWNLIGFNYF